MPDVTEATVEVGQMILHAIQNTFGMSPEAAVAQAQAATGVSDATIDHADMGHVFDYMCGQPGLSPEVHSYLTNASTNYQNSVHQSGGSYSGGGGYSGSNAEIVQQVTRNYNSEVINDNHIDILGPVDGNIDIDQDNDQIGDVHGDGNAINTGDGNQNAVTGDHSSGAQAGDDSNAQSNSGDGAVQVQGSDVEDSAIGNGSVAGEDNTVGDGNAVGEGNVAGDHNAVVNNEDGHIDDSSLGFGQGDVQGDVTNEAGAASSQGGDAQGHGAELDFGSNVEHGSGDLNTDASGQPVRELLQDSHEPVIPTHHEAATHEETQHQEAHEEPQHEALSDHLAPHVDAPAEDDHSALAAGGDEHHAM